MTEPIDWIEEGRKAFVKSRIKEAAMPDNYPTQDVHSPKDESDYIMGWKEQKGKWERGEGFSGLESYVREIEEQDDGEARA